MYPALILDQAVGSIERDDERDARQTDNQRANARSRNACEPMPHSKTNSADDRQRNEQDEGSERLPTRVSCIVAHGGTNDERNGDDAQRYRTPEAK